MRKIKIRHPADLYPTWAGKVALVLTDTGNGVVAKFKTVTSTENPLTFSMDYSQAAYLREALNKMENLD